MADLGSVGDGHGVRLNLGCGPLTSEGWVNVDVVPWPGVDQVADLDAAPWPWPDGGVSEIIASHVFEHIAEPVLFMSEAWRVLEADGILDIRVPWWRHMNAYTDPTHRRFCTEQTFDYWIDGELLHQGYGAGFGSEPGGPRYRLEAKRLAGETQEELRVILRKIP